MSPRKNPEPEPKLTGHYAGVVTRIASYAIDAFLVSALFSIVTAGVFWLLDLVTGQSYDASDAGSALGGLLFLVWIFLYFWVPMAAWGRTLGMAIMGLELVRRDGERAGAGRVAIRVVTFPISVLLLGLGFIGILFGREHRALHDVFAGTTIVYAWDARAARLRFLATHRTAR
ncbi:MAG TPA: RDD family protein [Acidimicrobiia bacterium]|jgi:uncharacterized RDD family membrane protein YckC